MSAPTHSRNSFLRVVLLVCAGIVSSVLMAQDANWASVALTQLESPYADEREAAKAELVAFEGDLTRTLRGCMGAASDNLKAELLDVAQLRADDALVQTAAELLGSGNTLLAPAARDYLLALDPGKLIVDETKLSEPCLIAWRAFGTYSMRFRMCGALIEAQLLPGKYFGQFEALRALAPQTLDTELLRLAQPETDFAEPLADAALARYRRGADSPDISRSNRMRRLGNAQAIGLALELVANHIPDEAFKLRLGGVEASVLTQALYVVQEVRIGAIRALSQSAAQDEMADRLMSFYLTVSRSPKNEVLARALDQEGLQEEIEVTLARFGRPELLDARISVQRKRFERELTGEASVTAKMSVETELQARNNIAYLYLRAGNAAQAEREWIATANQAAAQVATSTGRLRSSLSSTLGAIYYNLACAQSRQNKTSRCLASLSKAVESGYADFAWMLDDGDLEGARATEPFKAWFVRVAPPSLADRVAAGR